MTARINKLTAEQIARMPSFVREWVERGLSCEPAEWERVEAAVRECYALIDKPAPRVILRMQSPFGASLGGYSRGEAQEYTFCR